MDLPNGTILESDDEVRHVQETIRSQSEADRNVEASDQRGKPEIESAYRPSVRPPSAMLIICDDGQSTGEVIRLRHDRFMIGREEGDLKIADDEQISKRHVALTRQMIGGEHRWAITDLQSRNGLFVRVNRAPLTNHSEVLIGNGKYRFDIVQKEADETTGYAGAVLDFAVRNTKPHAVNLPFGTELLSELISTGIGTRFVLSKSEYWIGSSSSCEIIRAHDPFCKSRHAKLTRSAKGTWTIQNNQSLNGIWLKLPQVTIRAGACCEFQIGEQRFRLKFGRS